MYISHPDNDKHYRDLLSIFNLESFERFDYFFRKVHSDRDFIIECCDKIFRFIRKYDDTYAEDTIIVDNYYTIPLYSSERGSYGFMTDNPTCLNFDNFGNPNKLLLSGIADRDFDNGHHLYKLFLKKLGIHRNNPSELFRRLGINYDFIDRYTFCQKPCYIQEITFYNIINFTKNYSDSRFSTNFVNESNINDIISFNLFDVPYPMYYKYDFIDIYWYKSENGGKHFGVIYFKNKSNIYKLPMTMWKLVHPSKRYQISGGNISQEKAGRLDLLHPIPPYPVYNKDKISCTNYNLVIVICESEQVVATLEELQQNYKSTDIIFTTWSGGFRETIEDTDWDYLYNKKTAILISQDSDPHIFYDLYIRIKKAKTNFLGFLEENNLEKNINNLNDIKIMQINEFVKSVYDKKRIILDESYIDKSISYESLMSSELPQPKYIIKDLVKLGEQIMIFGPRGVSKSYFASLIAICLAAGKNILDDKFIVEAPSKVLIIDGEMDISLIRRRLSAIARGLSLEKIENLSVLSSSERKEIFNFSDGNQLKKYNESIANADIIVLDSVAFTFPEAMGNSIESSQKLNSFLLSNRNNCKTTIVIDHASTKGNSSSKDSFGTSSKSFALDLMISLIEQNDVIDVRITKGRSVRILGSLVRYKIISHNLEQYGSEKIEFKVIDNIHLHKSNGINIRDKIIGILRGINKPLSVPKITTQLGEMDIKISKSKVFKIINELRHQGIVDLRGKKKGYYLSSACDL